MTIQNLTSSPTANREIFTTHTYKKSPEALWEYWTNGKLIDLWWGPKGFTTTTEEMHPQVGGYWRFVMHGIDGTDYQNYVTYKEVLKPRKLHYHHGSSPNDTDGFEVTISFESSNETTKITMVQKYASEDEKEHAVREFAAVEGAKQTLERLEAIV